MSNSRPGWNRPSKQVDNKNRELNTDLQKQLSCTLWTLLSWCIRVKADQRESLHQHQAAVHTRGSEVRGFTWSSCVENGLHALVPADLLPYNNNHNPPPDQKTAKPLLGPSDVPSRCLWVVRYLQGGSGPHTAWPSPHLSWVTVGTSLRQNPAVHGFTLLV